MLSFEDVLKEFEEFLHAATYLEVLPCRWGYVRLFNEGDRLKKRCRIRKEIDFG